MCAPTVPRMSHILRGVVALLMAAALTRVGEAQAPRDTMPASLLRRLAEAADAHRSGGLVWFVADPRPPHDIDTTLFAPPPSDLATLGMPAGFRLYGPFRTEPDFGMPDPVFGCVHVKFPQSSAWGPPRRRLLGGLERPTGYCPMRAIPLDSIAQMELVVVTLDDTLRMPIAPRQVDAIFFSLSAFDKFVAPYYTQVQGPAYAQALRDSLEAFIRGR